MRASILAVALLASAVCFASGAWAQAGGPPSADPSVPTSAAADPSMTGPAADQSAAPGRAADPSVAASPAADSSAATPPAADAGAPSSPEAARDGPAALPAVAAPAGLSGRIVTPGRCPVPLGDGGPACPDRPYPTTVLILTPDGQPVASVPTATDGTFAVALRPGRYGVNPILANGQPAANSPISVDVPGDELVPLTIVVHGAAATRVP